MTDERITVLVTGVGGGGHGEQILKALLLAGRRYRVVGTDMSPRSHALAAVERGYLVPPAADPGYLDRLLEIARRENARAVMTGSEPELLRVSESRGVFEEAGIAVLLNVREVIALCQDKEQTVSFLEREGFLVPRSLVPRDDEAADAVDFLPAVVKPARAAGGSAHAYLALDREDLRFFVRYLRKHGIVPLVQEYVGTPEDEFTVGVLSGRAGEVLGSFALRRDLGSSLSCRLRVRVASPSGPATLAVSSGVSQGAVDDFADVRGVAEGIATRLGSRGPLNVQCRRTARGVLTFEINPRFSGTTSIRALMGFNEPDILIRHRLFGETPPPFCIRPGVVARSLIERYLPEEWMATLVRTGAVANEPGRAAVRLGVEVPQEARCP